MSEEYIMANQENVPISVVTSYNDIPYFMIEQDLVDVGREDYYNEAQEIIENYVKYETGADFSTEGGDGSYVPSQLDFTKSSTIMNKEARFLFANPPSFNVNIDDVKGELKEQNTIIQDYLDKVLEKNNFNGQLIKAVRDCFIGKRVAVVLNFKEDTGISLMFLNSLEFLFKYSKDNPTELERFICFHQTNCTINKAEQVWFKKVYYLKNGKVYVTENYYDGLGNILEEYADQAIEDMETLFTSIPATVILNDGLLGDVKGKSELQGLLDYESSYSRLANGDIDAERKSMSPVAYTIDASEDSTKNLAVGPGSFWDLQSDSDKPDEALHQAQVGMLEPSMQYSEALKITLDRIENAMYAEIDVPNINSEQLSGVITSGKTINALYWGLTVRCDEKWLTWGPSFKYIANMIIEGGKLYPNCIWKYTDDKIPEIEYDVTVQNNYPLPEDEKEEKEMDIAEVNAQLMSKKSYIKKWRELSDQEAEEELMQIKLEQDLFEDTYTPFDLDNPLKRSQRSQDEFINENNRNTNEDQKDVSGVNIDNQEGKEEIDE